MHKTQKSFVTKERTWLIQLFGIKISAKLSFAMTSWNMKENGIFLNKKQKWCQSYLTDLTDPKKKSNHVKMMATSKKIQNS